MKKAISKKSVKDGLGKLRELFVDYIKIDELNGKEIEIIVFFDNTAKNLKPVFDKYGKTMEFDKKDENSRLFIYMPLMDFYNIFEPSFVDAGGMSLDDILLAMIAYDKGHNFGHGMFLNIVNDVRNPEPEILKVFQIIEPPIKVRMHYWYY